MLRVYLEINYFVYHIYLTYTLCTKLMVIMNMLNGFDKKIF